MKKCIIYFYNLYIDFKNKIEKYIYGDRDYKEDYKDEEELDSLLNSEIDHPYESGDKVIYFN